MSPDRDFNAYVSLPLARRMMTLSSPLNRQCPLHPRPHVRRHEADGNTCGIPAESGYQLRQLPEINLISLHSQVARDLGHDSEDKGIGRWRAEGKKGP